MATVDQICPEYVGRDVLSLTPASTAGAQAFEPVELVVAVDPTKDTDGTAQRAGLMIPLELIVTSPSPENFFRHVYRRVLPASISFTPKEGGSHTVVLREVFHNRWLGKLVVDVAGETTDPRAQA